VMGIPAIRSRRGPRRRRPGKLRQTPRGQGLRRRRLTIRYQRHAHLFGGFLSLAAALTRWKKLPT
jgi:hypothetical protein